jgi:hypothetical protein
MQQRAGHAAEVVGDAPGECEVTAGGEGYVPKFH